MSESKNEKLRPVEVSVYRRVFLSRIEHGASVEAADRQGLQACKIWEQRGAFNDDESPGSARGQDSAKYADAFCALAKLMGDDIHVAMREFIDGKIDAVSFKARIMGPPPDEDTAGA